MRCLVILTLLLARGFASDVPPPAATPVTPDPAAQAGSKDNPKEKRVRMFPLKYADAEQLRRLFSPFSYPMTTNSVFNVLTVTAPLSFQEQVEAAVKQFDVAPEPPKNVVLTIYLLTGADAPGPMLPSKELAEMEQQLAAASTYKAFKLADSQVIRSRPGQPGETTGTDALSQIRFRAVWINSDEKGHVLSFDGLRVQLKSTTINSDVDLREGQWAVIGRANPDGVLVAMARVSE